MDLTLTLHVKLLNPTVKLPTHGSTDAIGYDLYAIANQNIASHSRSKVPLGIATAIPRGTYGHIAPCNSLAAKHSIDIGAGVIDPDYRGELIALLINNGNMDFSIKI